MSRVHDSRAALSPSTTSFEHHRRSISPGFVRAARDRLESELGKFAKSPAIRSPSSLDTSESRTDQTVATQATDSVQEEQSRITAPPMMAPAASEPASLSEPSSSDSLAQDAAATELNAPHQEEKEEPGSPEGEVEEEGQAGEDKERSEDESQADSPVDPFTDSGSSSPAQPPSKPGTQPIRPLHSAAPRRTPLGPPPSARRGAPSYYPHNAVVTPIIEESESYRSRASYASVIPEDGTASGRPSFVADRDGQTGVVRKASLGKRHSPNLTTIKSGTKLALALSSAGQPTVAADAIGGASTTASGAHRSALSSNGVIPHDPSSLLTATPSRRQSPLGFLDDVSFGGTQVRSVLPATNLDSPVLRVSVGVDNRDAIDAEAGPSSKAPTTLSSRLGSKVPAPINVEATKEAEPRASLASLPELIRRATRLAAILDRGKTASRLGVDAWVNEKLPSSSPHGADSLSDVLGPVPAADLAPTRSQTSTVAGRRRRCCGMPLWVAVLVFVILIIIIAAAIIIPVVLIVVPRQDGNDSVSTTVPKALALCQQTLPCANGGVSIISSTGACRCICVNGHTGDQCNLDPDAGCITANIGRVYNATVGSSIPRLLEGAQTNFSIPLNASAILSLFATQNLTCSSQNALVTFTGLTARSVSTHEAPLLDFPPAGVAFRIPSAAIDRRQVSSSVPSALTSNGILFAASPTSAASSTTSTPTPSTTSTSTSSNPGSPSRSPLDFARIAVLYILQQSMQFGTAATAQQYLQDYFASVGSAASDSRDQRNVTLGGGWEAMFPSFQIRLHGALVAGG